MPTLKQIGFTSVFIFALLSTAIAQESTRVPAQGSSLTITAAASGERVRITAPSSVVQMRVEVYSATGQKLLDNEVRGGNVFDWHLQDGQAQRLVPGTYVCVVTAKTISGKLIQKMGAVRVEESSVSVQPADSQQLSARQAETIGPVEDDSSWTISSWTILREKENQTSVVIAHDGADGQMIRGRGALTFRVGDFFSGNDKEQMRLTEAGDLGIGTAKPKAKLDVAGMIRAREGFLFANGSALNVNDKGALTLTNSDGSVVPNAAGTGTLNRVAKWMETGGAGTLGDSLISESNGNVVVGNAGQTGSIQIFGTAVQDVFGGMGPDVNAGPAFNYGYAGATFGRSAGFFNVRPDAGATPPNPSLRFMTANVERMIVTNTGNVGIGTSSPGAKLDVAGDINTSTHYNIGGNRVFSVEFANLNTVAGIAAGPVNAGFNNSFFGARAGEANATGQSNSFLGRDAGTNNTTGSNNSYFGEEAGRGLNPSTGSDNSFFGVLAGERISTGVANSFFGSEAGENNTTGQNNIFIGARSGSSNTVENNNTLIGVLADDAAGVTNATAIGNQASVTQSDSLVLGSINGINGATADTRVGIGTTAPVRHLHVFGAGDQQIAIESSDTNGRQWTLQSSKGTSDGRFEIVDRTANASRLAILSSGNVGIGMTAPTHRLEVNGSVAGVGPYQDISDLRFKKNIGPLSGALSRVLHMRGVSFDWRSDEFPALNFSQGRQVGFIAQEMAGVLPEAVTRDDKGYYRMAYSEVTPVLVEAIKEQQQQIQAQQLRAEQQQQQLQQKRARIEALEARLAALETVVKNISVRQRPRRR